MDSVLNHKNKMDLECPENYVWIYDNAFRLWQLNILLGEGGIKFRILFLKAQYLSEFLRSDLICSIQ